eukprot:12318453-Alexandrium_andersonii.AAC.1
MSASLVGSEMCIRDRRSAHQSCRQSAGWATAPTRQAGPGLVEELLLRAVQLQEGLGLRAVRRRGPNGHGEGEG